MIKKISETYELKTNAFKAEFEFNRDTKDVYLVVYRRDDEEEAMGHNLEKEFSMLIKTDAEIQELYDIFNHLYTINLKGETLPHNTAEEIQELNRQLEGKELDDEIDNFDLKL